MINKEEFEFHKSIIDWMVENGEIPIREALCIVSYAEQCQISIPKAYAYLGEPFTVCKTKDKNE